MLSLLRCIALLSLVATPCHAMPSLDPGAEEASSPEVPGSLEMPICLWNGVGQLDAPGGERSSCLVDRPGAPMEGGVQTSEFYCASCSRGELPLRCPRGARKFSRNPFDGTRDCGKSFKFSPRREAEMPSVWFQPLPD